MSKQENFPCSVKIESFYLSLHDYFDHTLSILILSKKRIRIDTQWILRNPFLQKVLFINCFSGPKEHNNVSEDNMSFLSWESMQYSSTYYGVYFALSNLIASIKLKSDIDWQTMTRMSLRRGCWHACPHSLPDNSWSGARRMASWVWWPPNSLTIQTYPGWYCQSRLVTVTTRPPDVWFHHLAQYFQPHRRDCLVQHNVISHQGNGPTFRTSPGRSSTSCKY